MKKVLLATTAILGVVGFASVAAADAPRVTVGGFIDFQAGYVNEDANAINNKDYGFRNDTEIHFSIDGKTDRGLGYGAVIELEADINGDTTGSGLESDRTYVYLSGDNWGRFELGANTDASTALKVDASSIARATGGIDGDWFRFAAAPLAAGFIVRPDLATQHGGTQTPGVTENANKVTYYSPDFSGLQLGVSYTPDASAKGQAFTSAPVPGTFEDTFSGGLSYARQFDGWNLGLSATGEYGDVSGAGLDDNKSWALGASVGVAGFTFAGSYGDQDVAGVEGDFWTLGAAYDINAFGLSLTYIDSTVDVAPGVSNDFDNLVFGVDYALAPGFTPYAEVSMFDYDGAGALDNDGTVFIVGTQLAF